MYVFFDLSKTSKKIKSSFLIVLVTNELIVPIKIILSFWVATNLNNVSGWSILGKYRETLFFSDKLLKKYLILLVKI